MIPSSSRFVISRKDDSVTPPIVYYFTKPQKERYPIVILCGGSTSKDCIGSIIHLHRYFLEEFLQLGVGLITLEQWGIDGNNVDPQMFLSHYTVSQRLNDHQTFINHLLSNPISGWNGRLILVGVSEGGPLVTVLTQRYSDTVCATINWCGASDCSWDQQLWDFLVYMRRHGPWWFKLWDILPNWMPLSTKLPKTKKNFDQKMQEVVQDASVKKEFMGMTNAYHANALQWPLHDYTTIKTPFLVVTGSEDPNIVASDCFVKKGKAAGMPITYLRVDGMDHYVRHRPDIIAQSFLWLKAHLE